jgi:hypothetical protein
VWEVSFKVFFLIFVADGLCCAWFISYLVLVLGPEIGTNSIDWAQLSRFHLKTETESSHVSNKNRTMDLSRNTITVLTYNRQKLLDLNNRRVSVTKPTKDMPSYSLLLNVNGILSSQFATAVLMVHNTLAAYSYNLLLLHCSPTGARSVTPVGLHFRRHTILSYSYLYNHYESYLCWYIFSERS